MNRTPFYLVAVVAAGLVVMGLTRVALRAGEHNGEGTAGCGAHGQCTHKAQDADQAGAKKQCCASQAAECGAKAGRHVEAIAEALDQVRAARQAVEAGKKKDALAALTKAESRLKDAHKAVRPAVVNARCPIMGGKVEAAAVPVTLYRPFEGEGVGFCCAGCPETWDKLSAKEKAAKLAKVTPGDEAKAQTEAARPPVVNDRCPIMGGKVDPEKVTDDLFRVHDGKGVGFCCAGCPAAWDKLTDEQKTARLTANFGSKAGDDD